MDTTTAAPVPANRAHIAQTPKFLQFIHGFQALVGAIIIGLTGYSLSYYSAGAYGLNIFASIFTWIAVAYALVSTTVAPKIYNYFALLAVQAVAIILWLSAFSSMAAAVALGVYYYYPTFNSYRYYKTKRSTIEKRDPDTAYNTSAAVAGLGGLEFLLFIGTFILTLMAVLRFRREKAAAAAGPAQSFNAGPMAENQNYQQGGIAAQNTGYDMSNQPQHTYDPMQQQPTGQQYPMQPQAPMQQQPMATQPTGSSYLSPQPTGAQHPPEHRDFSGHSELGGSTPVTRGAHEDAHEVPATKM